MSDPMTPAGVTADRRPRTRWGWFVALGILMILLGAFAWYDIVGLTFAGTIFIGAALLVGGVLQVVHAFMDRSWGGFLLQVAAGILYCIGGLLIMREPVAGSVVITLRAGHRDDRRRLFSDSARDPALASRRRRAAAAGRAGEHRGWHLVSPRATQRSVRSDSRTAPATPRSALYAISPHGCAPRRRTDKSSSLS